MHAYKVHVYIADIRPPVQSAAAAELQCAALTKDESMGRFKPHALDGTAQCVVKTIDRREGVNHLIAEPLRLLKIEDIHVTQVHLRIRHHA